MIDEPSASVAPESTDMDLLITLIQSGDEQTWHDFVLTFHGRLVAFAERQVGQIATAEDVVQETFVSFLRSLNSYRHDCEVETFLFQILRRRIVDHFRANGRRTELLACECMQHDQWNEGVPESAGGQNPWSILERRERQRLDERLLFEAIRTVCGRLTSRRKFRDLKIAEGTLYACQSNARISELVGCSPKEVAVVKHRLISRLRLAIEQLQTDPNNTAVQLSESLFAKVWEQQRPSCPKRTTLGKFVLGLLPDDWHDYVSFHTGDLGCRFCLANLDELRLAPKDESTSASFSKLFQSTIGFLYERV